MMDDVITLDLRTNQEKLEYLSVPSDYSHKNDPTEDPAQASSPTTQRGRSPRKTSVPADRSVEMLVDVTTRWHLPADFVFF